MTPHEVTVAVNGGGRTLTIPASGTVARVATQEVDEEAMEIWVGRGCPITLIVQEFGDVVNLPEPEEGKFFIVSALVRAACPGRYDLGSPARLVRDEQGRIVGCGALEVNR